MSQRSGFEEFSRMLRQFAGCYPSSLRDGHLPPTVMMSYHSLLGGVPLSVLARALGRLNGEAHAHMPSASIIMSTCSAITKGMPERSSGREAPPARRLAAHATGDGLPGRAADMPPIPGRRPMNQRELAATDYFLDKIRQMKLKGEKDGAKIVKTVMGKMGGDEVTGRLKYSDHYQGRIDAGRIPGADDTTCAAFADHLDRVRDGDAGGRDDPHEIGGRLMWTFSPKQRGHIREAILKASRYREQLPEVVERGETELTRRDAPTTGNSASADSEEGLPKPPARPNSALQDNGSPPSGGASSTELSGSEAAQRWLSESDTPGPTSTQETSTFSRNRLISNPRVGRTKGNGWPR